MTSVIVASTNPVKVQAVANGFRRMFPDLELTLAEVDVRSGVGHQPRSADETLRGATNRMRDAAALRPDADYWVGIEGGVEEIEEEMASFAWVVVGSRHLVGKARTGTFFLPPVVARLVRQGKELGEADDLVFDRSNSKQQNGAVGILTGDVVDRLELYEQAVALALIPFKNEALFSPAEADRCHEVPATALG